MTITEHIERLEPELQKCNQQLQHWNENRLRYEGALLILRQMKEEDEKAIATNSAGDTDSRTGPSVQPMATGHVQ